MKVFLGLPFAVLMAFSMVAKVGAENLCHDGVCIGDDVERLAVSWKPIEVTYQDQKFVETELADRRIEDVYFDYNEQLVADRSVLRDILTYVIRNQRFDGKVLASLGRVRAICSSLTLTGEVENDSSDRLFVTFRAVANNGQRGMLRVVRIEKQYNIMAPHLRPADASAYRTMKKDLKVQYPSLVNVRDIDGRASSSAAQHATALLGFRFISDVSNPLVLKIIDPTNLAMIEEDESAHPLCRTES
ncbi:MAG: hypothetical protein HWE13_04335 [Gammaproteobacteria bacterium]|nr:hypothetical protein [Gammaproteobacteria bacterium]